MCTYEGKLHKGDMIWIPPVMLITWRFFETFMRATGGCTTWCVNQQKLGLSDKHSPTFVRNMAGTKKVLRTWVAKGRLKSEKHNDVAERRTWWLWRSLQDVVQFVWKKSSPGMYFERKVTCRSLPYKRTTQELPRNCPETTQKLPRNWPGTTQKLPRNYPGMFRPVL